MVKFDLDFRIKVVTEYLSGVGSTSLARKYGISKEETILLWVSRFRKYGITGLKLKDQKPEYSSQFKVDVLNWRKQHQASLPVTALHFNLSSPSTIWQWEKRFEEQGIAGLERKRGKPKIMAKHKQTKPSKSRNNSSTADELKQLKQENLMLKIENEYLKKLDALAQKKSADKKSRK
ncbi:helix-turn-helix domain-containing protein [Levilactobacillus fuyuanensis]|uniref:Helix-turn-helix domain-containing protein n=1 Tax=Levilactobacillus fuyuanensis TaxID=2486022 RepID=A0ABW4H0P8_9LACO|nr:helix-turn-helix domain-containing protein [Levilactobacillus fuyuanensis]